MSYLSDASLVMIPSGYKDGKLYSQKPTDGSGDFTFSRGSNLAATRVNSDGLIEKGRENLLLQSNQFDTTWFLVGAPTLTGNQIGYDGTNDAWSLASTGTQFASVRQTISSSQLVTFSTYAKAGSNDFLIMFTGVTFSAVWFNLADGTIGRIESSVVDASIEHVGNGWYRCSITTLGASSCRLYPNDANASFGTASGNIYIQDAQLEVGLVATDYIETGATTAQAGILEDMPRLDYSGGATCPSLLLEPQRSNLLTHSEYFDAYNKLAATITTNAITSPDGNQNANKLVEDTSSSAHRFISDGFSTTSGTTYTASIYAKQGERRYAYFRLNNSGGDIASGTIDLQNGTVSQTANGTMSATLNSDGWVYITAIGTSVSTSAGYVELRTANSPTYSNYTGDGTSGVYCWGAQAEAGSYPTSYIPTYGSSVTRGADSSSVTGVSDVIGQTEGTAYVEFMFNNKGDAGVDASFFAMKNSSGSSYLNIFRLNTTLAFRLFDNGSNQFFHTETPANETLLKVAFAYKENDFALYVNGVQEAIDTSGSVGAMSQIYLAGFSVGDNITDNYKTMLFKTRLSNDELAALTTL